MAIGDIWRIANEGVYENQTLVNVWHIKLLSVGVDVEDACDYLKTNFYDLLKTYLSVYAAGDRWNCRQLAVPAPVFQKAYPWVGSLAGDGMPPQCAMVASLRTGIAGRTKRGRTYLGGFPESKQAGGGWDAAMVAAIQTYYDDLVAALGVGGSSTDFQWGVWSRKLGGDDPGPYNLAAGWQPISEVIVRQVVYTQRRRTWGVGI